MLLKNMCLFVISESALQNKICWHRSSIYFLYFLISVRMVWSCCFCIFSLGHRLVLTLQPTRDGAQLGSNFSFTQPGSSEAWRWWLSWELCWEGPTQLCWRAHPSLCCGHSLPWGHLFPDILYLLITEECRVMTQLLAWDFLSKMKIYLYGCDVLYW